MKLKTIGALLLAIPFSANAATIQGGSVTTNLGSDFFFNTAATGGNDFDSNNAFFFRDFGTLNVGVGGSDISITGIGWASRGFGSAVPTAATVTITYLGLDGSSGGGDDILIGSATDNFTDAGTGSTYYWAFDSAMNANIDGLNSQFSINIASTGNAMRYKTTSGSTAGAVKLSAAGTSVANAIPEPSTALLGALGALALLRRRR